MAAFEMYFETFNDVSEYVSPPLPQKKAYSCFGGQKYPWGPKIKALTVAKVVNGENFLFPHHFLFLFGFNSRNDKAKRMLNSSKTNPSFLTLILLMTPPGISNERG